MINSYGLNCVIMVVMGILLVFYSLLRVCLLNKNTKTIKRSHGIIKPIIKRSHEIINIISFP